MWVIPDVRGIAPEYEEVDVTDRLARRRAVPARIGTRRRRRDPDPPARRDALGRPPAPGRDGDACPTRRSCTCSSRRAVPRSTASARSTRATPSASPTRAPVRSPRDPTASSSPSGRPTPTPRDRVTSRGARAGGRRAPCRRSGTSGSTRPRATRTTPACRSSPHTGQGTPALPCTVKCSPSLFCRQAALARCARARAPRRAPRCSAASRRSRSSGCQRLQRRVRRELGAVQRCRRRSRGRRRRPCAGRAGSCARAARRRPCAPTRRTRRSSLRARASRADRSSPGPSTHQPALRSVPNSRTSTARSSENFSRTTEPFGLVFFGGGSKSTRPACERWTRACAGRRRSRGSGTWPAGRRRAACGRPALRAAGRTVFRPVNPSGS